MPRADDKKFKRAETIAVVLLSLATVLTSWCAFQSNQWSGEQYFRIDDETAANQFKLCRILPGQFCSEPDQTGTYIGPTVR